MQTTVTRLDGTPAQAPRGPARTSRRDDLVTVAVGLWLMAGAFLDGWAHIGRGAAPESFFTPWHAAFYSGFLASGLWIVLLSLRGARAGRVGLAAVPVGYELGLLGVVVFGLAGVGDMLWHTAFGIEVGVGAALSPTHLALVVGAVLMISSPVRSAWASSSLERAPGFAAFLPVLLSTLAALSFVTIENVYLWGLTGSAAGLVGTDMVAVLAGLFFTNVVLVTPVLLLVRRWLPPFGSLTALFGLNTWLMTVVSGRLLPDERVLAAAAAGLVADLLVRAWRPGPDRVPAMRAFGFAVPLALWGLHFLAGFPAVGDGLPLDVWSGATAMASLWGLALSVLAVPPALPPELARSVRLPDGPAS